MPNIIITKAQHANDHYEFLWRKQSMGADINAYEFGRRSLTRLVVTGYSSAWLATHVLLSGVEQAVADIPDTAVGNPGWLWCRACIKAATRRR